jgi:hypothetical protein
LLEGVHERCAGRIGEAATCGRSRVVQTVTLPELIRDPTAIASAIYYEGQGQQSTDAGSGSLAWMAGSMNFWKPV